MKDLLGTTEDQEDEALRQMWQDGLDECSCPLGRITYDDFRMFVKGQKVEREATSTSPIPKRPSKRFVMEGSLLQAVPEGSMSPQAKQQVFAKFDDIPALDTLKLPTLGLPLVPPLTPDLMGKKEQVVNIGFPADLPKTVHKRVRSRSLGETPLGEERYRFDEEELTSAAIRMALPCVVRPSKAIGELRHVIGDASKSGRVIHKALYRKHREFRQSVMVASKLFDQKQKTRKLQSALDASANRDTEPRKQTEHTTRNFDRRASLVMRRGKADDTVKVGSLETKSEHYTKTHGEERVGPIAVKSPVPPPVEASPEIDQLQTKQVADATKRSGRPRRQRHKTASDISGMLR